MQPLGVPPEQSRRSATRYSTPAKTVHPSKLQRSGATRHPQSVTLHTPNGPTIKLSDSPTVQRSNSPTVQLAHTAASFSFPKHPFVSFVSSVVNPKRIYLSPPHLDGDEFELVREAFETNWVAPVGPHLTAFEAEICNYTGASHAVALTSGTAALHLALILSGVGPGDRVYCPTLSFVATTNPILYEHAKPVFIDSEATSWNLDPEKLEATLVEDEKQNQLPKAIIAVDLYGQGADMPKIQAICDRFEIPLIEDAAEALGTRIGKDQTHAGCFGKFGVLSFNGNKIITTSGGGMLVTEDETLANQARKLATQARDPAVHYQHSELGFNYRLSNVLAGIGRGQLARLEAKIARRQEHFTAYESAFQDLPLTMQPQAPWSTHTRWLSCMTLNSDSVLNPWQICERMEEANIECRPLWKPLHLQPLYHSAEVPLGAPVAEELFQNGLCLPSGS